MGLYETYKEYENEEDRELELLEKVRTQGNFALTSGEVNDATVRSMRFGSGGAGSRQASHSPSRFRSQHSHDSKS